VDVNAELFPQQEHPMRRALSIVFVLTLSTASAGLVVAKPALKDVVQVREGLIVAGMAYEVSQKCDGISARLFRGLSFLNSLKKHARDLGYSDAEIDAYVEDNTEKTRLESIARARLASLGVVADQPQSYCLVGQAEIAAGTAIGQLLR